MLYSSTADSALLARNRFATGSVDTLSGPRVVVMCFDRLERDLAAAQRSIELGDHFETNAALGHAQDLLGELAAMLDVGAWEHGAALLSVYDYLLRLLATANVTKDAKLVGEAQRLVSELGDGFRGAAMHQSPAPTDASPQPDEPTEPRRLSIQA